MYNTLCTSFFFFFFFFNDPATTEIYPLPLHDALPISDPAGQVEDAESADDSTDRLHGALRRLDERSRDIARSEEHTSELQSPCNLVCRLLLEKKKNKLTRCMCNVTSIHRRTRIYSSTS